MSTKDIRTQLRYDADIQVQLQVYYSFRTEVDFAIDDQMPNDKYIGFSKNISVNGICIESNNDLQIDDNLLLEIHLPDTDETINAQGTVRWTQLSSPPLQLPKSYLVGIAINAVDGVDVKETIYFDKKYSIYWSELLERVLGSFAQLHKKKTTVTVLRGILKDKNERYLMLKRSPKCKSWPLKWEFPGGKVDPGEHASNTLKREFLEETSIEIKPLQRFIDYIYEEKDLTIEYQLFFVENISGVPVISDEHIELGWFTLNEMLTLDISPSLLDAIEHLRNPV